MIGQAIKYANAVRTKQMNASAVDRLLFADADSCNTYREDKGALFYYAHGYYDALMEE